MIISRRPTTIIVIILAAFFFGCQRSTGGELSENKTASKSSLFADIEKLANQGNPEAQYHLGMMYNNGFGVRQDPQKAFEWFTKAADSGEPLAAYKIGCYFAGQFRGVVEVDPAKSLQFKLIAAKQGYSFAQSDVGNAFFKQGSYDDAIRWWKLAAAQGYSQAMNNLSVVYREGKVVQQDKILAYSYSKLASLTSYGEVDPNTEVILSGLANTMTSEEMERAENVVSAWKAESSPLTIKAKSGVEEAEKLVSNVNNKP